MNYKLLIQNLQSQWEIRLTETDSLKEISEKLEIYISDLILHDFQKLVSLLYRIDVSENKLRMMLQENPNESAAKMIGQLIIERQTQKIISREKYSGKSDVHGEDPDFEVW
jgi:hypothetical protein